MCSVNNSSLILIIDQELDQIIYLCTRISQIASNIRYIHLSTVSYSSESISILLSMAENIEGSMILLESLLNSQQRCLLFNPIETTKRFNYNRNKLYELRKNVTMKLSNNIGFLLKQVVERECNDSVTKEKKSWRDIRTILM